MNQDILIVDTAELRLQQLNQALRGRNYLVKVVHNEADLLGALESCDCQLVFINLEVPQATALCDAMRQSLTGAIVPAIFVGTADATHASIHSPADALSAGGDYYFAQPLDMPRVLAKVQTYVGLGDGADVQLDSLADLDQPTQAAAPRAPAADGQALAGASDALLAQIMSRETELADLVRETPSPLAPSAKTYTEHLQTRGALQPPAAQSAAADEPSREAKEAAFHAAIKEAPRPTATAVATQPTVYTPLAPAFGNLDASYDVARLLSDAHRQRVTGRIVIENGHAQVLMFVLDGTPVRVQTLSSRDRLEDYLLRHHKIDATQYQQVRIRSLRRTSLVRAFLLEKNLVSADVLQEALHAQLREQIVGLFAYTVGSYSYGPQLCDAPSRVHLRQDIRCILMQGIREHYVLPQLKRKVGSLQSFVAIRPEQQGSLDALSLSGSELALLSLLDGNRSLQEVVALSGLKAERVYQAVYGMLCVDAAQVTVHHPVEAHDAERASDYAAACKIGEKLHQARMQDYFQILGLSANASPEDIAAGFAQMSQKYAPAAFSLAVQTELMQSLREIGTILQEAHDVLSEPQLRALYSRHVA